MKRKRYTEPQIVFALQQLRHPFFRVQPVGCLHHCFHLVLQLFGQIAHHVLDLVIATVLNRICPASVGTGLFSRFVRQ